MINLTKENNGNIATFLTEWDISFDLLLYVLVISNFSIFPWWSTIPFETIQQPYMFWI